jgi:hypothetical protein
MRTKNHDWINTETKEILLGIQVSGDGKKWRNLALNGKPFFAGNELERKLKRDEIRNMNHNFSLK